MAGDDGYLDIRNEFYKDTHSAFLIYDVTKKSTFENLNSWIEELNKFQSEKVHIVLVANKIDLDRQVTKEEGQNKAADLGAE